MNQQQCEICNRIYEENKDYLKWYMWKHFPEMQEEDLHDLMQETWKKLSECIDVVSNRSRAEQYNWVTTVCHNLTISFLRKKNRFTESYDDLDEQITYTKPGNSMEEEVIEKLVMKNLLENLTEDERRFFLEYRLLSPEEKRSNSVNCKIYRIRKKLRKIWKEGDWDE